MEGTVIENDATVGGSDDGNPTGDPSTIRGEHCAPNTANGGLNDGFNGQIIAQTGTSVTVEWNLLEEVDVYEIERFHKRRGWEAVTWTSRSPAVVEKLEENFAYRLRIKALSLNEDAHKYVVEAVSSDIIATTLSILPTTLCLYRAIKKGQQFLVKRILRRRPSLLEHAGPNGYLPLANAIAFGENCIIDVLLTAGASIHKGNPWNGRTPLHMAFYYGRLAIARMLLNKKADMEAGDTNGMTACHFAVDANRSEVLRFALENGANPEARDVSGWTLLLRAVVMEAEMGIVKLIITHGADMTAVDRFGQNCVDLARLYRNEAATKHFAKIRKLKGKDKDDATKSA